MSDTKYSVSSHPKQPPIDHKKANELTVRIAEQIRMAVAYADIALQYEQIFDYTGFDMATEKFVGYAKDINKNLAALRKHRGVLD